MMLAIGTKASDFYPDGSERNGLIPVWSTRDKKRALLLFQRPDQRLHQPSLFLPRFLFPVLGKRRVSTGA